MRLHARSLGDITMALPRRQGKTARSETAAAKRTKYATLRVQGVGSVNAVRQAGYRPGSRRAARAQARKLDVAIGLTGFEELEHALVGGGIDYDRVARAIKKAMDNPRTALSAVALVGRWMGWERPRDPTPDRQESLSFDDLLELRDMLRQQAEEAQRSALDTPVKAE